MPKVKTNKSAAKRFKKTGSGGYKHRQSHRNHILTKKSSKPKAINGLLIMVDFLLIDDQSFNNQRKMEKC